MRSYPLRSVRGIASLCCAALLLASGPRVLAAPISTDALLAAEAGPAADTSGARARLALALDREDVQQALAERGVALDQVRARVAALSDAEAASLQAQVDQAPAGADGILGALIFVFVLLLVTDILGLTKVFPFTRAIAHR